MEGTNKAHENGEAMGFVGVRLTVMLGHRYWFCVLSLMSETALPNQGEALLGILPALDGGCCA